jgi:hypothetical protein
MKPKCEGQGGLCSLSTAEQREVRRQWSRLVIGLVLLSNQFDLLDIMGFVR